MSIKGGRTYTPSRGTLQTLAEGGIPWGEVEDPPCRERCMCLVHIVHHMWHTGEIPQEFRWTVLVIIPKETTNTWGIGLLDTLWKVVEALIDTHLQASLHMHDILYRFRSRRGTWMAIMELKLAQELASIDQSPLLLVFLEERGLVYAGDLLSKLQLHYSHPRLSSGPEPV